MSLQGWLWGQQSCPLFPLGACDGGFLLAGDGDGALGDIAQLAGSADGQHPVQRQRRRDGQRVHIVRDPVFPAELPGDETVLVLSQKGEEKRLLMRDARPALP